MTLTDQQRLEKLTAARELIVDVINSYPPVGRAYSGEEPDERIQRQIEESAARLKWPMFHLRKQEYARAATE